MVKVVGIKFRNNPKIYDFAESGEKVEVGDSVIVETSFGQEAGTVVYIDKEVKKDPPTQKVIRKAHEEDFGNQQKLQKDKEKFEKIFRESVKKYNLEMKLVDVEISFEDKIIFLFTAENRVDFRELVKHLSKALKKQIRLKQIGPRDESRYLGGFGQCGRPLCCLQFLQACDSVTMDMARDQNMASKGSAKISGLCGRLMCCLGYEDSLYKELLKKLPKVGERIKTKDGVGKIINISALNRKAEVEFSDGSKKEVDL